MFSALRGCFVGGCSGFRNSFAVFVDDTDVCWVGRVP